MPHLPQANAVLLSINGGGTSEDYDVSAGTDPAKWQGEEDAYVKESIKSALNPNGGSLNRAKDTRLIIPGDLEPPVAINAGDTVTYVYQGQTLTRQIEDYSAALLEGIPHATVQLHLTPIDV